MTWAIVIGSTIVAVFFATEEYPRWRRRVTVRRERAEARADRRLA